MRTMDKDGKESMKELVSSILKMLLLDFDSVAELRIEENVTGGKVEWVFQQK